jgi:hypothetical protein
MFNYSITNHMNIHIVYHTYICNEKSLNIISGQLYDIKMSGIMDVSKLDIMITYNWNTDNRLVTRGREIINSFKNEYASKINVIEKGENEYEYLGINRLYQLACENPECIFIYMHTKGASHKTTTEYRSFENIFFTRTLLWNWGDKYNIFSNDPDINYMGMFPAMQHLVWFNFFWVRGTYIKKCEKPLEHPPTRYYYESWLSSGRSATDKHGYCLYKGKEFSFDQKTTLNEHQRFMITKVTYGSNKHNIDITNIFIEKLSKNINFKINNDLAHRDPHVGVVKKLSITFGDKFNTTLMEHSKFDSTVFFENVIKRNGS